jgi:DNA-directed RNA polymerase subunit K/omega
MDNITSKNNKSLPLANSEIIGEAFTNQAFSDILLNYDISKNRSSHIMTKYEKTNIIGFRLEQISFGSRTTLTKEDEAKCHSTRDIVEKEFKMNLIPFIVCRTLNGNKEYFKISDMIYFE